MARIGPVTHIVEFLPEARISVLVGCFHFSVSTMTTLGYGDISPNFLSVKLVSDLQVLLGVILIVVSLGMAIGNWWGTGELANSRSLGDSRSERLKACAFLFAGFIFFGAFGKVLYVRDYIYWTDVTTRVFMVTHGRGSIQDARRSAEESLLLAARHRADWNFGNAIHDANNILGLIALRKGDVKGAKVYLLQAGSTTGSPQLNTFGPSMPLAKELLDLGEREVVLRYLDLCELFWEGRQKLLRKWADEIKRGGVPDFASDRYKVQSTEP